jgi:hypothetical protein
VFIEQVNPGPVDPIIIFVMGGPDQVEISPHEDRDIGRLNLVGNFQQKIRGARMIRRAINSHDLATKLIRTADDVGADEVSAPLDAPNIESAIAETHQHTP